MGLDHATADLDRFGPPLSDWERSDEALTDKFRTEFPDGIVPVRHVPTRPVSLACLDLLYGCVKSVARCAELREQFALTYHGIGSDEGMALGREPQSNVTKLDSGSRRQALIGELMEQGLSLREIARYLPLPEHDVIAVYCRGATSPEARLALDDAFVACLRAGKTSLAIAPLARQLGINASTARNAASARGLRSVGLGGGNNGAALNRPHYAEVKARLSTLAADGAKATVITDQLITEFPQATWLNYWWVARNRREAVAGVAA